MSDAQNSPNQDDTFLVAAQQAADDFCAPSDPFAPDQQAITAQILGHPISQGHSSQS